MVLEFKSFYSKLVEVRCRHSCSSPLNYISSCLLGVQCKYSVMLTKMKEMPVFSLKTGRTGILVAEEHFRHFKSVIILVIPIEDLNIILTVYIDVITNNLAVQTAF